MAWYGASQSVATPGEFWQAMGVVRKYLAANGVRPDSPVGQAYIRFVTDVMGSDFNEFTRES